MKTRFSLLLVVAVIISISATGQQRGERFRNRQNDFEKHQMRGERINGAWQRIDNFFNEEQKESIKKARLEASRKIKPLGNELRELQAHQQSLVTAENADLKAINKNIDKMASLKTEIAKIRAEQHQKIRSLLTEEQFVKYDTRIKRFKGPTKRKQQMRG